MDSGVPQTAVAESWAHLLDLLYAESWDKAILRHRCPFVFRGMACADNELTTSLIRLAKSHEDAGRIEAHLLRNFRKYAQAETAMGPSLWNWLALAAHHGLPTRLMDWTYSPLVALHFATSAVNRFAEDGVVWMVTHGRTNRLLPSRLLDVLEGEGSDVFSAELLESVAGRFEDLQKLAQEPFLLFLEPPSLDSRIVNQFALFSLISDPMVPPGEYLARHPDLCRRILLPARLKWEIRDKLDQAGVTERVLFPGLDGLTAWLTRYYTRRNDAEAFCEDDRHQGERITQFRVK